MEGNNEGTGGAEREADPSLAEADLLRAAERERLRARQAAVLRYRSRLQIVVRGQRGRLGRYWHTDSYERRDGR